MGRMVSRPQSFTARPWYRLTVALPATASVTYASLGSAIGDQLFGAPGQVFEVKLHSVRYWAQFPTTASTPTIGQASLSVLDVLYHVTNLERVLTVVSGFPDQVNRVSLGFKYPPAQRDFVIQTTGTTVLLRTTGAGSTGVLYFDLLWRTDVTNPPGFSVISPSPQVLLQEPPQKPSENSLASRGCLLCKYDQCPPERLPCEFGSANCQTSPLVLSSSDEEDEEIDVGIEYQGY